MSQNNNFKIIIGLIIILLALTLFLINQTPQRPNINNDTISSDYIKVSADGAILFNTTGYNVTDISETIKNSSEGYKHYYLNDTYSNEAIISTHHSDISDENSPEAEFLRTDYYIQPPIWVGEHDKNYYMVSLEDTNNEEIFNADFIYKRVINNDKK